MSDQPQRTEATLPGGNGQPAKPGLPRRWLLLILVLAFLFVLMPFLFWRATWFGRPLSDEEIARDLADTQHPRKAQHALSQVADRMLSREPGVAASARRWYPQVIALAGSPHAALRTTAAWVMGQDNREAPFHAALLRLLQDTDPMVRRNAALALVRFGDDAGREVIRGLLQPYGEPAPTGGVLRQRLKPGDTVNPGTLLARVEAGGSRVEMRATVPGTLSRWLVSDGANVASGTPVAAIDPSPEEQWEALRALYFIGRAEDLPLVDPLAAGRSDVGDAIRKQAQLTARSIRARFPK